MTLLTNSKKDIIPDNFFIQLLNKEKEIIPMQKERETNRFNTFFYKDQIKLIQFMREHKIIKKQSEFNGFAIDLVFNFMPILLKHSDEHFILKNQNKWSHQEYNQFCHYMMRFLEFYQDYEKFFQSNSDTDTSIKK